MNTTIKLDVAGVGPVEVTYGDQGEGRAFLLLHGGAGPISMAGFAVLVTTARPARVLSPTHPGFNGTPRPSSLSDVKGLAKLYAALLKELKLSDVTVVGNSVGGWIAAELAILGPDSVRRVVIVDGVGVAVEGHPVADVSGKSLPEIQGLSYYEPEKFRVDPTTFTGEQRAASAANFATLAAYAGGAAMVDSTLLERLGAVQVPTLVLWGEADQIVDVDYGRAFAAAIPAAKFQLLNRTGHLPQVEAPNALLEIVWEFADRQ